VASKEHVENGKKLGIAQFCHGKSWPAKRLTRGDYIIYYSSKVSMERSELCQKFTAIGIVIDEAPYQVEEKDTDFKPYRRNIRYFEDTLPDLDIRPLVPLLSFIKNTKSWGSVFRSGFFEIDHDSFEIIAKNMLGFNPLD